jgi:hypothetical protein
MLARSYPHPQSQLSPCIAVATFVFAFAYSTLAPAQSTQATKEVPASTTPAVTQSATSPTASKIEPILKNPMLTPSTEQDNLPADWSFDGIAQEYGFDATHRKGNAPSWAVKFKEGGPYAGIAQRIPIEAVRGKTLKASALIDRENLNPKNEAQVGIWVGAWDKDRKRIAYVNTYEGKQGDKGAWTPHNMTITIPPEADRVMFGVAIYERDGRMWVTDIRLAAQ